MTTHETPPTFEVQAFHDPATFTLTYVVFDPASRDAVVIDPVMDYDPASDATSTASLERVAAFIYERDLQPRFVLETHAHADHVSGAQWLRERFGARVAIGARIREVQATFASKLALPHVATDGSQFDRLLSDGEVVAAGTLEVAILATPGHTPACVTYRIGDALFTGDALFMHDYGTGRCDFPGGSAAVLYDSITRLYTLPDATRVFPGHDYTPGGRAVMWETSIGRSKRENLQLREGTTRDAFVALRTARDRTLSAPRLLHPSIDLNIDAGRLPPTAGFVDVDANFVAQRQVDLSLVDVREPAEFYGELGHIAGALLVPLSTIGAVSGTWPRDRPVVVVCRAGARGASAARLLVERGFRRVYNLRGGMQAWRAAGLPVER